ncbi:MULTISPECIES: DUF2141 domain-containing protein [unclassified Siphonobacter]|uniref:DUF2141 domain-containing protein n=1 Tax=unclassified Siphonobacter TaxID=2635712 RepID=UPI000CC31B05|nr:MULTISPECIES: DUF2141 domain-containing protein [unclassified Siphonobacter]MDQ1086015.1 uncharacterized protein (DUF2141 family) [Siphonobacter sp. SORGH_AS_1065]MDR6196339.1 uncharacterized protein (DUF2141 family) [Siphonobacter sp. SORGH_AS_0500]PKK38051.1 hypothetical protein BWI96_02940 [Siphonobacter sp. SORGH_AS_0500]
MKVLLILSQFVFTLGLTSPPKQEPLAITITNLKNTRAPLKIAVFRKTDEFLKKPFKSYTLEPNGGSSPTLFADDLPYGEYAVAIFQDENKDGKLNTNLLGIPKEPYCFSQNYRPKIKSPKFESCKFIYSAKDNRMYLQLL